MLHALQTHFGSPLGSASLLNAIRARRFRMVRIDAQRSDTATMLAMIAESVAADLQPLAIVAEASQVAYLAGFDVELGNEHDPGGVGMQQTPAVYRARLEEACQVAQHVGARLWAPGLSNLDENSLKWLNQVKGSGWPEGLHGVSVHRYGDGTFEKPHAGFTTRDREVFWLKAALSGLPFLISEFGYPNTDSITEQQAADRIAKEWAFWERHGAYAAVLYQINDGIGSGEKYGIRRVDGSWKPAADTVPSDAADPPPPPVDGPKYAAFAVVAQTEDDKPIPDATVLVSTDGRQGRTNAAGYVVFEALEQKPLTFSVHKAGYADYFSAVVELIGNLQVEVRLERTAPVVPPLSRLRAERFGFRNAANDRVFIKGVSAFMHYERFLRGEDIDPLLAQVRELGSNCVRVFGMAHYIPVNAGRPAFKPQDWGEDYWTKQPAFFEKCAAFGQYVYWSVFPDAELIGVVDKRAFFDREVATLKQAENTFGELTNEQDAHRFNAVDPASVTRPKGIAFCSGSYGDIGGLQPHQWDFVDYHTPRGNWTKHIKDSCVVDHPNYLAGAGVLLGEPDRFGAGGNGDVDLCRISAGTSRENALGQIFHSAQGRESVLYDDNTLAPARAFFAALA